MALCRPSQGDATLPRSTTRLMCLLVQLAVVLAFGFYASALRSFPLPPSFPTWTRTPQFLSSRPASEQQPVIGVIAPLNYLGPYPCLSLRFPKLNESLDFLIDSGATVNTIGRDLPQKHKLPIWNESFPGIEAAGVGGNLNSVGSIVKLGDCELVGLPPEQTTTFITNVLAMSLGHATRVGDGILGCMFIESFVAGMEFDWRGTDGDPPTFIFYYGDDLPPLEDVRCNLVCLPLTRLPVGLLSLPVSVNGYNVTTILDTGSPITVVSPEVAKIMDIDTCSSNQVGPVYGSETLAVCGVDGTPLHLHRSRSLGVQIQAGSASLGAGPVYVGEMPGLSMTTSLTGTTLPGVVLGLDALSRSYRMIL